MKMMSLVLLIFITVKISANEKWIEIEPLNKTQTSKSNTKIDVNLSQIEPISKIMKNATVMKQLMDATSKKDAPASNEKNWFVLNNENSK
ncbi:hypothetical protein KJ870_08155 [bacterium]|nr:hypothetical protein [bacterium]MBU1434893.1 hypothetical protein [bacterium]MBU1503998.1 hypothetical protein [bacterium]